MSRAGHDRGPDNADAAAAVVLTAVLGPPLAAARAAKTISGTVARGATGLLYDRGAAAGDPVTRRGPRPAAHRGQAYMAERGATRSW